MLSAKSLDVFVRVFSAAVRFDLFIVNDDKHPIAFRDILEDKTDYPSMQTIEMMAQISLISIYLPSILFLIPFPLIVASILFVIRTSFHGVFCRDITTFATLKNI
ncbi:hypothetical protein HQ42_10105 [Porphyromonas gulae]|nr:hypothetical protein HQ49_00880 [Porphyromonas gulae]KGO01818.1 hypothetical protein HQ42_10105 [Porphyromonas gulae]